MEETDEFLVHGISRNRKYSPKLLDVSEKYHLEFTNTYKHPLMQLYLTHSCTHILLTKASRTHYLRRIDMGTSYNNCYWWSIFFMEYWIKRWIWVLRNSYWNHWNCIYCINMYDFYTPIFVLFTHYIH